MLVEGKFAKPLPYCADVHRQALGDRLGAPSILIEAPSGYLLTGCLAALLEEAGKQIIWLRLGPEDVDPASCLWSLAMAAQQVDRQAGLEALYRMQRLPGPLQGWPGLFELLGRDCASRFNGSTTWVFEHTHHLARSPQTFALLVNHFIRLLPADQQVILTTQERIVMPCVRKPIVQINLDDLALSPKAMEFLLQKSGLGLQTGCARRAVGLAQGRAVALLGLCGAAQTLGESWVERCLKQSQSQNESFNQIIRTCLTGLDRHSQETLNILAFLGYDHPAINQSITGEASLPSGPWTQPLSQSWIRPYHLWHQPLRTAVSARDAFCPPVLGAAADYLCRNDAALNGIGLLFEINCLEQAAYYLAQSAARLLSCGFWETVHRWLDLLPPGLLIDRPWLLLASAEIKSCSGDLHGAMHLFEQAAERFHADADPRGAIACMLALSATAAWTGDQGKAWGSADGARCLAQASHLFGQQAWAEFQLACLAAREGDLQPAAAHFRDAAGLALQTEEPFILDCIRSMEVLVGEQQRLYEVRLRQQKVYEACEQAEQEGARRLAQALQAPHKSAESMLAAQSWFQIPLFFKIPENALKQSVAGQGVSPAGGPGLKGWLRRLWAASGRGGENIPPMDIKYPEVNLATGESITTSAPPPPLSVQADQMRIQLAGKNLSLAEAELEARIEMPAGAPSLVVYCLGSFRVLQNEQPIVQWNSLKSQSIFKYLISLGGKSVAKDVLIEMFWPDIDFDSARRNLHQAIYSLRQTLRRTHPDYAHIQFENNSYFLNPEMDVWSDFQEFENRVKAGRRQEAMGRLAEANVEYGVAESIYQGDYLEEDLYEEWPRATREYLRVLYLEISETLIEYHLSHDECTAASALCRKVLSRDSCREPVHRLLIRCYLAQGQRHLALRQYHSCVQILMEELGLEPEEATQALFPLITMAD